ncbi:GrpB family protein [Bacillus salacetis]|uniref:GrpB family protein n=1 Tax=Bacillus salacetis TaxID=2315464 RepID=UPI003BA01C0D
MARKVEVTPYNHQWKDQFFHEKQRLDRVFHGSYAVVHHIGSTSVEGLAAKPIIDFLIVVQDINIADERTSELEDLGYIAKGENGIPNRRYFFLENENGERLYHVHVFPSGSEEIERHLVFRDYLRTFKDEAEKYGRLKSGLAAKHPEDIDAYIEGKNSFVQEMERKAMDWGRKHD